MDIVVRDYQESDIIEVNKILVEAFSIEKQPFQGEEFREIVVSVDGHIAGYLLLTRVLNPIQNRVYFLIDYTCVAGAYRGLGLGQKLLDYAYSIAKEQKAMYLQLSCSRFRIAAHKLYEKCNFYMRESDIFRKDVL